MEFAERAQETLAYSRLNWSVQGLNDQRDARLKKQGLQVAVRHP